MTETSIINFQITASSGANAMWLTGNHESIGNWDPEGLALENQGGTWRSTLEVPKGTFLEFKITDGTWEKEASFKTVSEKENLRLMANQDIDIELEFDHWLENPATAQDDILGKIEYLGLISGDGIQDREVIVWLPTQYLENPRKKFPVLYTHDGQNMVDPNTAFLNNDWRIDETIEALAAKGRITPPIVVGLYNTKDRFEEYADTELGRNYLNFIVKKVKPIIDDRFRTLKGKKHNCVMGSSMGGLISFLSAWYHPKVFGQVACLSPMFWGKKMVNVKAWQMVEANPRQAIKARVYMDNGTKDLERSLMPGCRHMLRVLKERGYRENDKLMWFKDEGAWHNEAAWANRVWKPLEFMFGK